MAEEPTPFTLTRAGLRLEGEVSGEGAPLVLLHGLTATRRYVVHGSRALERAGFRVAAFDARGHGESSRADAPSEYTYDRMVADALAVMDHFGWERAALAGQSMGSATALGLAVAHPQRVSGLVVITPAHRGAPSGERALARWDRLADALEHGGPQAFLAALEPFTMDERYRATVRRVIAQRLARHRDPAAVADAMRGVPRSRAFAGLEALEGLSVPTLIVASRDESDPDHPLEIAREYRRLIPDSRLVIEGPGESPLAWRGGALSQVIGAHLSGRTVAGAV